MERKINYFILFILFKTATKERGEKNFCHTFLFSLKCHKIEHYFSFEVLKKKIRANFQRIIELFT